MIYLYLHPTEYRDRSRLLTLDGMTGAIKDRHFKDIKTLRIGRLSGIK